MKQKKNDEYINAKRNLIDIYGFEEDEITTELIELEILFEKESK